MASEENSWKFTIASFLHTNELGEHSVTLPKTNMAPENKVSQKEISIPTIYFQVLR